VLPNPILPPLVLGPITLYAFDILVAVAIVIGVRMSAKRAEKFGLDPEIIYDTSLWAVLPGFIGAHLFAQILYSPEEILKDPLSLLRIWSHLSSIGGFIGGTAGIMYYFRSRKIPFWPYMDVIVYGFAIAWIFGRLGCTVSFDHPGALTDFFLGMQFPGSKEISSGVRHNLGFYEFLWAVGLSAFFTASKKQRFVGWYLLTAGLAYFPLRFAADFLRAADAVYLGLTPAQLAIIPAMGLTIWLYLRRRSSTAN